MKITLCFFGKLSELTSDEKELVRRIGFRSKIELVPLPQAGLSAIEKTKQKEGELILKKIEKKEFVVFFDEKGKEKDSLGFSNWLKSKLVEHGEVVFVIGGAYGIDKNILSRANETLCFGKMVWTRNLFRHMALEQMYRALEIDGGSHFHK